jgi:hypothetical protein
MSDNTSRTLMAVPRIGRLRAVLTFSPQHLRGFAAMGAVIARRILIILSRCSGAPPFIFLS